ncbi:MAG: A/G-specific adenine glycosylase [Clostridium sp.]|nr:A/G-specific adenine glycosylase [Clostridium sp.]MCM1209311.1 A/G-specific adenine glycosylase [Ruminococcus sp.]
MNKCKKLAQYLFDWYPTHARDLPWRKDKEPYHVWLSEIMLQQTRVEAVKEYYKRFLEALPSIEDLAAVEDDYLLKLWEGLGYYNRARNLKKAAITIVEDLDGKFPSTYEGILSLAGIGEYTAGAIGSICFDLPTPAVDGNVLRVYTRVMEDSSNIDKQATKKKIREKLAEAYFEGHCGTLTQGLMELGATVCLPNGTPRCEECPLKNLCSAREHDTWQHYPVRDEKKNRRQEEKTVFVLQCGDRVAVRKRTGKGLLSGMWEFPNVEGTLIEQQAADTAGSWNTAPEQMKMCFHYTHVFTHVEWRMTAYYLTCSRMCEQLHWVTLEELEHDVAVPSAFRPCLDIVKQVE